MKVGIVSNRDTAKNKDNNHIRNTTMEVWK